MAHSQDWVAWFSDVIWGLDFCYLCKHLCLQLVYSGLFLLVCRGKDWKEHSRYPGHTGTTITLQSVTRKHMVKKQYDSMPIQHHQIGDGRIFRSGLLWHTPSAGSPIKWFEPPNNWLTFIYLRSKDSVHILGFRILWYDFFYLVWYD